MQCWEKIGYEGDITTWRYDSLSGTMGFPSRFQASLSARPRDAGWVLYTITYTAGGCTGGTEGARMC